MNNESSIKLAELEKKYTEYDDPSFVHPDPLEHVLKETSMREAEVTGLIASSFAYGRVHAILKITAEILGRTGFRPAEYLAGSSKVDIEHDFSDIKYRYTTASETADFLYGIKKASCEYGSLLECFLSCLKSGEESYAQAALRFSEKIRAYSGSERMSLLPISGSQSPCKRLMLFFRWMIRKDNVDPGWWHDAADTSKLIVPLDTHMHSIGIDLGFTKRKNASMKAAEEITGNFRRFCPEDPVKYDFCLTRSGIRGDGFMPEFKQKWDTAGSFEAFG